MYELSKQILQNVSFDKALFKKELAKALKWIKPDERLMLYAWCISTFGQQYGKEITQIFRAIART
jgi:hypothetical protein